MEYLSDEDIKRAKENGIYKDLLYKRFYNNGWDKERAITEPKHIKMGRKRRYEDKWYKQAESNGISMQTMHKRIGLGWSLQEAVSIPIGQKRREI